MIIQNKQKIQIRLQVKRNWSNTDRFIKRILYAPKFENGVLTDPLTPFKAATYINLSDDFTMKFEELSKPTFFLSSPTDLMLLRGNIVEMFRRLREKVAYNKGIVPFAWEAEKPDEGYDHGRPVIEQIPLAKGRFCKAVACLFAEKIGTPVPNAKEYVKFLGDFDQRRAKGGEHLVLDWKPGDELNGGFALTGTVFELLTVLANNKLAEESGEETIPLKVFFIGDESILEAQAENAKWGNRKLFNQKLDEYQKNGQSGEISSWIQNVYNPQVRQLKNLIMFLMDIRGLHINVQDAIYNDSNELVKKCESFLINQLKYKLNQDINPFKGLEFYDEDDEEYFFGRTKWLGGAIEQFGQRWKDSEYVPFFGIVGGSGVGKSSLLRAGMISRLKKSDEYGLFKGIVLTSNDLIPPTIKEGKIKHFADTSLGKIVEKSLCEIYKKYNEEKNTRILSGEDKETIKKILNRVDKLSMEIQPEVAVEYLESALDCVAGREKLSSPNELNLVVGLDQFEEFVDHWQSSDDSRYLEALFEFLRLACDSERIGFIYTCQTNRERILIENKILAALVKKGIQKEVPPLDEDDIRDLTHKKFLKANVILSEEIIDELYQRIKKFAIENEDSLSQNKAADKSELQNITFEEAKATLLPLFSLTLVRMYEYCQERRKELDSGENKPIVSAFTRLTDSEFIKEEFTDIEENEKDESGTGTHLNKDNILVLTLEEDLKEILNIEKAITELADTALRKVGESPGTNFSKDTLGELFRRFVRIQSALEDRYYLPSVAVPKKGAGKIFIDKFREYRLLIPMSQEHVKLVHESIVRHWKYAKEWVENEKELLMISERLISSAKFWEKENRSSDIVSFLIKKDDELVDSAGRILCSWWDVFNRKDGTKPIQADELLCDFAFAILEAAMTPNRVAKGIDTEFSHFLIAVEYGRKEIIKKYLEIEPSAAKKHRTSKENNATFLATYLEDLETLNLVLENGADAALPNNDGWQAIHSAAHLGNMECFERLVKEGADPNVSNLKFGRTCLHLAALNDEQAILRHLLITYKVDPNVQDSEGWTPLHLACQYASWESVKLLLDTESIDTSLTLKNNWTALHVACRYGNAQMVAALLQNPKTDPNAVTDDGWTPLLLSIYNDSIDIKKNQSNHPVTALFNDERVERNIKTVAKKTPLDLAVAAKNLDMLAVLVNDPLRMIDLNLSFADEKSPLFKACENKDVDLINLLVEAGADVNGSSEGGFPFLAVVKRGDMEVLKLLLAKADVFKADGNGNTALHIACQNGQVEVVKNLFETTLLKKQISDIKPNAGGMTPLHLAALNGSPVMVEMLLEFFDAGSKNVFGAIALHLAADAGFAEVTEIFLNFDKELANISDDLGRNLSHIISAKEDLSFATRFSDDFKPQVEDADGMNGLYYAVRFGNIETINYLLEHYHINPNSTDNFGWTPLHLAAQNGRMDVAEKLLEYGAVKSIIGNNPSFLPIHCAVETGQTEMIELLMPEDESSEALEKLVNELLLIAVKNVQFKTASKLLTFQQIYNNL